MTSSKMQSLVQPSVSIAYKSMCYEPQPSAKKYETKYGEYAVVDEVEIKKMAV